MTAPGGGEPNRDQPGPWQQYQHPPVDPQTPLNYPDDPYPPPYGSYPPPYGYAGPPPMYPYNPYQGYPQQQTNTLAVASLVTAIAGVVVGVPLAVFCYIGWVIPVVGAVLGAVALNQIKLTGQQGRGMALAGVIIGSTTAGLLIMIMIVYTAAMFHAPMFMR